MKPTMTTADIAQLVGVTRRHVTGQIVKRPGFPKPCINASQRLRAWPTSKVLAYFQGIGKQVKSAPQSPPPSPGSNNCNVSL